jgi:hypothetical protein
MSDNIDHLQEAEDNEWEVNDIVEELREAARVQGYPNDTLQDAALQIESLRAENAAQALLIASLKDEAKWKVQAEALWSMALILETEIKDESKNALFRSGVQVSIAKLKTTAQMLMDFQEDYKWNAENATEQLPK